MIKPMPWQHSLRVTEMVISIAIGLLFIYAGILKWMDFNAFADAIRGFRLLPDAIVIPLAYTLPSLEIVAGCALLLPGARREAALILAILCVIFIAALASAAWRGLQISCGCFGSSSSGEGTVTLLIVRNLAFVLGLYFVFWIRFAHSRKYKICGRRMGSSIFAG